MSDCPRCIAMGATCFLHFIEDATKLFDQLAAIGIHNQEQLDQRFKAALKAKGNA